jgi:hypothetical protein
MDQLHHATRSLIRAAALILRVMRKAPMWLAR